MSATTDEMYGRVLKHLNNPLPPECVKQHPYSDLDYIPTEIAIDRANWIFGNLNWSSTLVQKEMVNLEQIETKKGQKLWSCTWAFTISIRVHVRECGIDCERIGSKAGTSEVPRKGDAIANALASAESECMRRAFRTFGHGLGNGLYDNPINKGRFPGALTSELEMTDTFRMFYEKLGTLKKEERPAFKAEMAAHVGLDDDDRIELLYRMAKGGK